MRRLLMPTNQPNGTDVIFSLPSGFSYIPGSLAIIVNGLTYLSSDTEGALELTSTTLQTKNVLALGDVLLLSIDDGNTTETAIDLQVTGNATQYGVDWNGQTYSQDYSVNLSKINYNVGAYSITYNTNQFKV